MRPARGFIFLRGIHSLEQTWQPLPWWPSDLLVPATRPLLCIRPSLLSHYRSYFTRRLGTMRLSAREAAKCLQRMLSSVWENDASHPAARQKRPWGLNRWVLLAIYMVYATLTSSVYFGWRSMSALLFKSGQFEWVCDDQPRAPASEAAGGGSQNPPGFLCELQDAKIQSLFTIAMACHFTCSALAGWMLDTVGPKTVALLGQLFNSLAWVLLAFSGRHFQSIYPAFVFMGAGADVSVYPTLLVVSLFPQNTAIVMAIMGACISTSFFVPYVLKVLWQRVDMSFQALCFTYVLAGPVLCMILSLLFVPHRAFKGVDAFKICVEVEKLRKDTTGHGNELQEGGQSSGTTREPVATMGEREAGEEALQQMETTAESIIEQRGNLAAAGIDVASEGQPSEFVGMKSEEELQARNPREVTANAGEGGETADRSSDDSSADDSPSREKKAMLARVADCVSEGSFGELETKNTAFPDTEDFTAIVDDPRFQKEQVSFLSQSLTFLYVGICVYFVICGWAMSFFQEAAGRFLSPAVEHNLELLTPLSTLPCIVFGILINRLGIMTVIFILNSFGFVMYVCVLCATSSLVAQHISVICFFFYISVFTTQMYVYIESTFDSSHFGKLIGGASMVGGLLSLLSNVLYGDVTVRLFAGDVRPVSGGLLCLLGLTYPMLLLMVIKRRRRCQAQQLEVTKRVEELKATYRNGEFIV